MTTTLPFGFAKGLGPRITARCNNPTHTPIYLFNYQHQPSERLSHEDRAFRALLRASILQAIQDLASRSGKQEAKRAKQEAEEWLASPAFDAWCVDAGYEPDYIRRKIFEAAQRGFQWRKPAGTGWRTQKRLKGHEA